MTKKKILIALAVDWNGDAVAAVIHGGCDWRSVEHITSYVSRGGLRRYIVSVEVDAPDKATEISGAVEEVKP